MAYGTIYLVHKLQQVGAQTMQRSERHHASSCYRPSKSKPIYDAAVQRNGLDVGNDDVLESVGKFCYLGNRLTADGGADLAVVARVREICLEEVQRVVSHLDFQRCIAELQGRIQEFYFGGGQTKVPNRKLRAKPEIEGAKRPSIEGEA